MDIFVLDPLAQAYKRSGGKNKVILDIARDGDCYHSSSGVDSDFVTEADLKKLIQLSEKNPKLTDDTWKRRQLRVLKAVLTFKQGKQKRTPNLEIMAGALRECLISLPNHWVFLRGFGGQLLPWFIEDIEFHEAERGRDYNHPAYIGIALVAKYRGERKEKKKNIYRELLGSGGCSPETLLERVGFLKESPELRKVYKQELILYKQWAPLRGEQFNAVGKAQTGLSDDDDDDDDDDRRWWGRDSILRLDRDEGPSRFVMDDQVCFGNKKEEQENESVYCDTHFWYRAKDEIDKEENEEYGAPVPAPIHPVVCGFTLMTHEFVETHITNLTPYEYNEELSKKLVLPKDFRELIDVLIDTSTKNSEDVVGGKKGGVVILCSGPPGTGKTLTAEVYAEVAKRPLYPVQCSQLGVDSEELEKELGKVLRRSIRWNAITLIDEADVYIHNRGTNVNQNAIVGVFLRLLEYYSGVLFLTTNRETVVDDAISSRCIAHVRYKIPETHEDRFALWTILSRQYQVKLDKVQINKLIETFPDVSGRTIKQFCRLAQAMGKNRDADLELFSWLAKFQDIETKDN